MKNCKKQVFVLTAPFYKTGGTELCHQLVHGINSIGGNASVLYKQAADNRYLNPAFSKYIGEYHILADEIYEEYDGTIVIPESETLEIPKFKKATIYLWWMSVDNYFRWQNLKYVCEEVGVLRTIKYFFGTYSFKKKYLPLNKMKNVDLHLAQSEYAINFLNMNGITNIKHLSDFINEDYFLKAETLKNEKRDDVIIYNPSKGFLFTKKIIRYNKNIKFVPLEGMTNKEIMSYMAKAKVYIDFGAHPGKDRMPREAAIMGCCIITGKRGSAAFDDVCIPEKYKFQNSVLNIPKISQTLNDLLENYIDKIQEYEKYRRKIINEKREFYDDMKNIFMDN